MLDALIERWLRNKFERLTEPQLMGWPEIAAGHDVLISAPTGSGKTLAAFLICLDRLVREARAGTLTNETRVVYVSPLKALSTDIRKNLEVPLAEIAALAAEEGLHLPQIRTAVRTGDTTTTERARMTRKPPHVLVTTPESLYILLTAEQSRKRLEGVRTVILDEIHAIAGDKRGSHLALSVARLDALAGRPQRIGLSATVRPLDEIGRLLGPSTRIVDSGSRRPMDLAVETPSGDLSAVLSTAQWDEVYKRVAELIAQHRTTLVFVNTRRLSERVAHALRERLGTGAILPHHGSLSRELRFEAEDRLKRGELQAVVATASLELGIDIGSVDLVCQLGSPRSLAVALQRIGRSGHWVGAQPKGRIFPTTRDELVDAAALVYGIRNGALERVAIAENARDILAQQIVAEVAAGPRREDEVFALVRSAYPYRRLPRETFDEVVAMLSEGIVNARGRSGAFLHRDQVNGWLRPRRGARLAAITSGGGIPETGNYTVIAEPEGRTVGTIDEDFAVESMVGDVFLLGHHSWKVRRVEPGRVRVEDAGGQPPSIPFWLGEGPGRSLELSEQTWAIRERLLEDGAVDFLRNECALDEIAAHAAVEYVRQGTAALGALPSGGTVVAERFFDEGGGMQLVLHAPFGSRITRAWGLALRKRFCRTFNFELQAAATDNGLVLSLGEQHSFPLEVVFEFVKSATAEYVLSQALLAAPMFGARWRWNATRALAVLRSRGGRRVPAPIQRMRSDDLLAAVFPDQAACAENLTGPPRIPDHPLVRETIENCLYEAMDFAGWKRILEQVESGGIRTVAVDTAEPSVFCHEVLNANPYAFLDDAPLEERRARAVYLRQSMRGDDREPGVLDERAIEQVAEEVWPEVRDAEELHDALLTMIRVPAVAEWAQWFDELARSRRAVDRDGVWIAAERLAQADEAIDAVRGWMDCLGPVTHTELSQRLRLPADAVETALLQLEAEGQILRGSFRPGARSTEWCHRRILARIHRLTIGKLRREIEPVAAADFYRFLCRWQHASPGRLLHGVDGLRQVIGQLQGFEAPAVAWEQSILPRRVANYEAGLLDELCLAGEVMWARLEPHPALESGKRVRPTRLAPVSLFLRGEANWLLPERGDLPVESLSHAAREVLAELRASGACFFVELQQATRRLPTEIEDALWELVAAGVVTGDGFENLRALIDPKRRRGEGVARRGRPRQAAGRWALVRARGAEPDRIERFARQLLLRWGVLFRDLLQRESVTPPWRELQPVLRRMEARDEIRGGRFVAGFSGEQFARPEAVDLLRAVRREGADSMDAAPAADPLNLAGVILPGPRLSAMAGSQWIPEPNG